MAKEIERKFVLTGKPENCKELLHGEMWTWYLSTEKDNEHRVRKDITYGEPVYTETRKSGTGLSRDEFEHNISEDDFNKLRKQVASEGIHYEFWRIESEGEVMDLVHVDNALWVLEKEFDTEKEALAWKLPSNVHGMDVTYAEMYKMRNYWKRTRLGG